MSDTAVKTSALESGIKSLVSVGDRLVQLAAGDRLDDDRDVIGEIATAMTNVRTEVTAVSRRLDVVQRDAQQCRHERDVAYQQARDAEAREAQSVTGGRTTMQLMAAGCVVACLSTGFAARWWYAPAQMVAEQRAPVLALPVPPVPVAPVVGAGVTTSTSGLMPAGTTTTPQAIGDYACAFGYQPAPGLNCPQDSRGVTGQHRSTKTVR